MKQGLRKKPGRGRRAEESRRVRMGQRTTEVGCEDGQLGLDKINSETPFRSMAIPSGGAEKESLALHKKFLEYLTTNPSSLQPTHKLQSCVRVPGLLKYRGEPFTGDRGARKPRGLNHSSTECWGRG